MDDNGLAQAIKLIKSGDVDSGQSILLRLLQHDAANEAAWLWLAKTYIDNRVQYCMEKVLEINPHNEIAQAFMRKQEMLNQELEQKKYQEKIRIEDLSKKYLREDGILVFKPSKNRLLRRMLPGAILFFIFFIVITNLYQAFDFANIFRFALILIALLGLMVYITTGSWLNIELSATTISGPGSISNPFFRRTISIQDIDLEDTGTFYNLMHFYILNSKNEKPIVLFRFDTETLQDLTDIIHFRQMN